MKSTNVLLGLLAVAGVAATTTDALARTLRFSGFECYTYSSTDVWAEPRFQCPVPNWTTDGLEDYTDVYVELTIGHPSNDFIPSGGNFMPAAKACVHYSSSTTGAFGSGCGIEAKLAANLSPGARTIHLEHDQLVPADDNLSVFRLHQFGFAYLSIFSGGLDADTPDDFQTYGYIPPALIRGYRVLSTE
ncbi:hypothetical protein WME95_42145 [Sorangium sp. So ce327]|jgi:hypothetical protein|uniref:hypothetical protein n=1 Tax=Sorangium sp. So ce327 TaxID=3133301 RepID=UPI003F640170